MMKMSVVIVALAGLTLLDAYPAQAYYEGKWCAVSSLGRGSAIERCEFNDFEACRMEIIAGNRGFCRLNGYYLEKAGAAHRKRSRR